MRDVSENTLENGNVSGNVDGNDIMWENEWKFESGMRGSVEDCAGK